MDLALQVARCIAEHGLLQRGQCVVVGVSGGADSLCLLHLLKHLAPKLDLALHAAHLNHQIRGQAADDDAAYVAQLCQAWGIPCTITAQDVPALAAANRQSIEETARQERYSFLAQVAREQGCQQIAVAHHADDQVETVLMHFIRGAGLGGLRGMLPITTLQGHPGLALIRPLLTTSRQEIEAYCAQHGITPRFDRTNLDTTYFRNRIRHELMPTLESYNPNIRQVIQRSAQAIAGDYAVLETALAKAWSRVVRHQDAQGVVLDLSGLRLLPLGLQRSVLRRGIQRLRTSLRDIGWVHIDSAVSLLATGATGDQAALPGGLMLTLGYETAWLAEQNFEPPAKGPQISRATRLTLPGNTVIAGGAWTIEATRIARHALPQDWRENQNPLLAYVDADRLVSPLTLRSRKAGDAFMPLGGQRVQSLRRYMINAKIPSHQRDHVPLLTSTDEIVWVMGWRLDARYAVRDTTEHVMILRCTPRAEGNERKP